MTFFTLALVLCTGVVVLCTILILNLLNRYLIALGYLAICLQKTREALATHAVKCEELEETISSWKGEL